MSIETDRPWPTGEAARPLCKRQWGLEVRNKRQGAGLAKKAGKYARCRKVRELFMRQWPWLEKPGIIYEAMGPCFRS